MALPQLREYAEEGVAIILVGNKVDLLDSDPDARQVSHEEAVQWAQEHGLEYLETSAKSGQNVEEVSTSKSPLLGMWSGADAIRFLAFPLPSSLLFNRPSLEQQP